MRVPVLLKAVLVCLAITSTLAQEEVAYDQGHADVTDQGAADVVVEQEVEVAAPVVEEEPPVPQPDVISVREARVRIEESDGKATTDITLTPPAAATATLHLDHTQTLKVGFTVVSQSGEVFRPQQAVVRLTSKQTGAAAYFAATKGSNKDGSLSATVKSSGVEAQMGPQGGAFEAVLLLGDTRAVAPVEWRLGEVSVLHVPLDDGSQPQGPKPHPIDVLMAPLPEIVHMHRPAEKRTPGIVSLAAAAACLAPLPLLLVLLARVGANVKGFPTGPAALWAILFHAGLLAILVLYLLFWLRLNIMQTVPTAALIGLFTAGFGHKAFSSMASSRQKQE